MSDAPAHNSVSDEPADEPSSARTEQLLDNLIDKQAGLDLDDDEDHQSNLAPPTSAKTDEEHEKRRAYESTLSAEQLLENQLKATEFKTTGNALFKSNDYVESVDSYNDGLAVCPLDCKADRSILYGNRAAAHIQLGNQTLAIQDCTDALAANPQYIKVLLRRAKLYEETDKLDESLQDFKSVLELDGSSVEAAQALVRLPPKIDERNEKLKTEMLGKLKDLGNMFLRPFGLSTNNFQMKQDPSTGSYSVNFNQNPGH